MGIRLSMRHVHRGAAPNPAWQFILNVDDAHMSRIKNARRIFRGYFIIMRVFGVISGHGVVTEGNTL